MSLQKGRFQHERYANEHAVMGDGCTQGSDSDMSEPKLSAVLLETETASENHRSMK